MGSSAEVALTASQVSMVVGITHPQTCLILTPRLRALRKAGFEVTLLCGPGELSRQTAAETGVQQAEIPMVRDISPWADLKALVRMIRMLRRIRPQLVEFSTPKAGLLGSLAAFLSRVPHRVYMLRGLKLETATGWKRKVLLAAERVACACAHVVLSNSESLAARALELRVAPRCKLWVLGEGSSNGVDLNRFAPGASNLRQRLGIEPEAPVIGFVGRLTRDKGVPELLEAFETVLAAYPGARLLLVGWFDAAEDALGKDMRTWIETHPRVICTGMVEDTAPYYRAMDLLVLPTWREGFPNAVLEAEASGIPVVTTLSTGSRDSVLPEVTGLLVPPGYPEAIAEAVLKLLGDPELRRKMGRAARAWVQEHYLEEDVLSRTIGFYHRLIESNPRDRSTPKETKPIQAEPAVAR